jgi:GxxExxY protein
LKLLVYAWRYIEYWGRGFAEIVYKDAIEHELKLRNIPYEREKKYEVAYKGIVLPHYFFADFVINNIIVEIKAQRGVVEEQYDQIINYLAISKLPIGLLINFGENSFKIQKNNILICESVAITISIK